MKKNVGNVQSSQGIRNNQQLKNVQNAYGQKPSSSSNAHTNAVNKPGSSSSNSKTPSALGNNNNSNFVEEKRRPQTNSERLKNNQGLHGDSVQQRKVNNAQSASSLSHIEKKDEHSAGQHYSNEMGLESGDVEDVIRELSTEEDELIKIISQHLTVKHCPQTAQMFIQEIYQPTNPHNQQTLLMHAITKAFEQGNRDLFFGKWVKLPHQPAQHPQVIDKLEFYLQIYFLIYEIHPLFKTKEAISSDRIEYFREYLESKGSELSKTTELLSFYALPYVPKPSEHPGFKQLFTKDWVIDLRQKLTAALEKLTREHSNLTDLEQIYYASKRGLQEQQIQEQQQYPQPYIIHAQGNNNINRDDPQHSQQQQLQQPQQSINFPDNSYIVDNSALRANNVQYLTVLEELNQRYYNLHKVYVQVQDQAKQAIMDSHHKWFKIGQDLVHLSQDLIQMVEAAANGVPPQISVFESKKKKLSQFEHFLSSNIEDLVHQSQDISLFEKQVSIIEYDQSPILNQYKQQQHILQFDQSVPRTYGNNNYDNSNNGGRKLQMQNNSGQYDQQYNLAVPAGVPYGVDGQQQAQQQQLIQQQQQQQQQQLLYQQQQQQYEDQSYAPIDFNKIKQVLKSDSTNPEQKTTILQALRWRIAKTRSAYQRREVIISYTLNDILGCLNQDTVLQQAIFNSNNLKLTECGLRLVNALASDFQGRTYLVASEALVKLLISILWKEQEDSPTRRNALGALQKLSLRKKSQLVMIQNDLIKWIVETLRNEKDELSEYSYEYATALFMNLSLRSLGRDKCEDENLHVIEVLQRLLEHDSQQVRTFVNGTLYSLLGRPALREQCRQLSLQQYLIHLRENSEERFHNQLSYIIEQLQKDEDDYDDEENNSNLGEGHEDEDNDEDDIEDEEIDEEEEEEDDEEEGEDDDAADAYNNINQEGQRVNGMIGENLLIQQFSLRGPEALRQRNMTRTALEESKRNAHNQSVINQSRISSNNKPEPFNRPATPSLSISQISHSQIPGYHQENNKQKQHNNQMNNKQNNNNNNNQGNNAKQTGGLPQLKNNNNGLDQQQQDQDQYQLGEVHRQQQQKQLGQQSVQSAGQSQTKGGFGQNEQQSQSNPNGNSVSSLNKARAVQQQYQQGQQQQPQQQQQQPFKQQQQQQQSSSSAVQSTEQQKNTKEAFAPRPKIPRTPPTKDEGEEEEE